MSADRSVHANHPDGREIVRYEKAGKWYIERPNVPHYRRRNLSINDAVQEAIAIRLEGGTVHFARRGGAMFDSKVRRTLSQEQS